MKKITKLIPSNLKRPTKSVINWIKNIVKYIKRKIIKTVRKIKPLSTKNARHFAILCIKKTIYADLTIANINSLHLINPNHKITLYCDIVCFEYLQSKKNKIDYLENIFIINTYHEANDPWQFYKIETHITASWNDQILIDADSLWHQDVVIDKNKVTLLVKAYQISQQENENALVDKTLNKPEWQNFNHYVSAFVSIPKTLMTKEIENDLRDINEKIFNSNLDFIKIDEQREGVRRLSEELSISISIQKNIPEDKITTLKTTDGPGNNDRFQSLYYGCLNKINE